MTDEEKAREWVRTNSGYSTKEFHGQKAIEAFLAGLKAGKETEREYVKNNAFTSMKEQGLFPFGKWHNLRKDPNDLPLVHSTVLDENGDKVEYIEYGKWQAYSEYYERYYEVDPPIAWCEIPKFEE